MKFLVRTLVLLVIPLFGAVAQAAPSALTYQGRILKSDNTPLEFNNVSFQFEITSPDGLCVLYREQVNGINMVNSGGVFDVPIGVAGTQSYPGNGTFTLLDAFNNGASLNCDGGAPYVPQFDDGRKLRVKFHDGTGWQTISPDSTIRSVPYAGYSYSAAKLGTNTANDFILKTGIPTCGSGTFLSWNGSALTCAGVSGASGGTVTNVTSANSYIVVANNTTTPQLTLNVGTAANTVAAGNDPRIVNAIQTGGTASGDLSGTYPGPSVVALRGVGVSNTVPTSGQFFKFNGTNWIGAAIDVSDVTNLSSTLTGYQTTSAFNTAVGSANCAAYETPYWSSVSGKFLCQAINVSLAGDVSGSIGAASVDKIKGYGIDLSTAPTNGQVLKYNGTKWVAAADNNGGGTVTSVSGSAPITVANGTTTPAISISQATTSTNGYLSSTDWNTFNGKQAAGNYITALTGDVTASGPGSAAATVAKLQGSTVTITTPANKDYLKFNGTAFVNSPLAAADLTGTLAASNIPSLDWSKITTGKPINLSGYGITDAILNAGGTPSIQTGTDASKPASPTAGAIYFATDSKVIYQYNSGAWVAIASSSGSGGTITGVTAGTGLSGGGTTGTVTVNLANTAVTAGAYTRANITVDAQGRITAAANGASVNLASEVTGTLPIANGGTGATTALAAFNALSPLTTKGDIHVRDGSNNIRLPVGADGQLLSADSTQASGLNWISPTTGTVTNVTGTAPIVVATGTTTPAISVNAATTSTQGVVQVGSGIAVSSGTISADPANFPSAVPVSKGGTGATTMTANRLIASNGTGTAYIPFTCTVGQVVSFDATGLMICSSFTTGSVFLNGGNSFAAAANLGTNDAYALNIKTNNVTRINIDNTGRVGIASTSQSDAGLIVRSSVAGDVPIAIDTPANGIPSIDMSRNGTWKGTIGYADSAANDLYVSNGVAGNIIFDTSNDEKFRITSTGSLLVAKTGQRFQADFSNSTISNRFLFQTSTTDTNSVLGVIPNGAPANMGAGYAAFNNSTPTNSARIMIAVDQGTAYLSSDIQGAGTYLPLTLNAGGAERMRVATSGNIGIGTSSPTSRLHIANGATFNPGANMTAALSVAGSFGGGIALIDGSNTASIYTNNSGNTLLFNAGGTAAGISAYSMSLTQLGNLAIPGCLTYGGGTLGTCVSDRRLKKDIHSFDLGLDKLLGLQPVYYKYNGLGGIEADKQERLGFIAQEVEKVAPELVETRQVKMHPGDKEETEIKAVDYGKMTFVVINAIKDFYHEFLQSKEEVATLKRSVASLQEENTALKKKAAQSDAVNAEILKRLERLEKAQQK